MSCMQVSLAYSIHQVWLTSILGSCDGMTYEEIEKTYPAEFERRKTVFMAIILYNVQLLSLVMA